MSTGALWLATYVLIILISSFCFCYEQNWGRRGMESCPVFSLFNLILPHIFSSKTLHFSLNLFSWSLSMAEINISYIHLFTDTRNSYKYSLSLPAWFWMYIQCLSYNSMKLKWFKMLSFSSFGSANIRYHICLMWNLY